MNALTATNAAGSGVPDRAQEVIAAAETHDGLPPVSDQALLSAAQGRRALLLFGEGEEHAAAVGIVGEGEVDLVVHPGSRGRGLGSAALDALLARDPGELRAWSHGDNPAADALLERAGFAPVRTLLRMTLDPALLPGDGVDPLALPAPEGYALRSFDPTSPADHAAWVRVNAAAFAHHPEQGRITEADLALITHEPWFDPQDLILLESPVPGALAGSTWVKTVASEQEDAGPECELYAIGVHPDHAGRGLGRLLLDATLARMAQHSPSGVSLYVDGDNEAAGMYERAGFTIASRSRQWLRTTNMAHEMADGARMDP